MKKSLLSKMMVLVFVFVGFINAAKAQVTTSTISGTVKDARAGLPGSSVKATHTPTGTVYSAMTDVQGKFSLPNLRVGGPYTIEVSYVGFKPEKVENVFLKLGETFPLNVNLSDEGTNLTEIVVSGQRDQTMNSKRTGAATNVSRQQLESLPTLNRSLQDFTRLTPQASGNSFGGANNRYNNITIDGAINNDVFGLSASGTPGGPANTQPISLDAIQEIQIVLAPYDVSQGNFTGGGVNAVTRSGTNNFEGSVYFFGRNENTTGKNVLTDVKSTEFMNNQYGVRIGGPIIQNKLFFFANAEFQRIKSPLFNNAGENGAAITLATAKQIADHTLTTYGYDVGSYNASDVKTENEKIFAKLDWNINPKNQLTIRYNYINAFDDNISRSSSFFRFGNNAYQFANTQNNTVLELRTNISDKYSNNLILGYSRIRDAREIAGKLFPQITINNIDGKSANSVELGAQRSSVANELDQDIFEFTDNFKINMGKHLITLGTHNEFFKFRNLFINDNNGRWEYNNVEDYIANKPNRVRATYSIIPGDLRPSAEFSAAQLGFYAQDEFEAFTGFKLTAGLRVDLPVFGEAPPANPKVVAAFPQYRTDVTMKSTPLISPRVGFNYDVFGDRSLQFRGGTGIFTGRVPFVWLSNQYSNSGMLFGAVDVTKANNPALGFIADPNNQQSAGPLISRAQINILEEDFKIPQVFRTNLAVDVKLPYGVVGTLEGIYSKTLNNITYKDINVKPSTATVNPLFSDGNDTRKLYSTATAGKVDGTNFTNVILLGNTSRGYTYNLTAQLQKTFSNGVSAMVAYTNSEAKAVNDGASSTAVSNWEFVQHVNDANDPLLTRSNFLTRHRVIGALNYRIEYGKSKAYATAFSLFYAGRSGQRFTYLYNGDFNADGATGNDLLYVPRTAAEIKLVNLNIGTTAVPIIVSPADQWTALNAFIENDEYLNSRRGQYTERNGAESPFEHQFDARISQDLGAIVKGTKNRIQLTFDIFNVGNLINKSWGRQYTVTNQALTLVNYVSNANIANAGFTFRAPSTNVGYQTSPFGSAWSGQFGIRYLFN
ncbi:TonB-dependent receptor [Pedobacter psychroterrae]|uniref:TonB-dependent receptor n=1 Tax=Pedobacter psychroterrae TaxID=2530453 RepID=A0A4R0NKH4_9SPHI|nr:TonB-dependent receptor [Pedobacter psychroterrae]TCC99833.1 TonB-dependent receptor [Pedobacter psychroterrae]